MDAIIARQPIFDRHRRVTAYELLYRDEVTAQHARFTDGNRATSRLLSDAITVFGLSTLTNGKPAFVNFTENLILNNFVRLARPEEVVVEILEDTVVTDALVQRLQELKDAGYQLALDDFVGGNGFDRILPMIDVLKVDFMLTSTETQASMASLKRLFPQMKLLAEKVETEEVYRRAVKQGYDLFQGYFFARPTTMRQQLHPLAATSYGRLMMELNRRGGMDFSNCARIIHRDTTLTYRILKKVHLLRYYRGNEVRGVLQALVILGEDETRRWITLMLARENNVTHSEELVRHAYLRGLFARKLMQCRHRGRAGSESAFLLGMFSLLGEIFGYGLRELLESVDIDDEVRSALLGQEDNYYSCLLTFLEDYENGLIEEVDPRLELQISTQEIAHIYMNCLVQADSDFAATEVERRHALVGTIPNSV